MKQPKLIKKLREIPPKERQEFLILEYCQSEYELRVIEGKNVIDEALKATIEFRNTLHNRYEDFQPLRDFSKFKTMPLREYFNRLTHYETEYNAIKNQLDERDSSEYELKRNLEIDYLKIQLEAEKERSKGLEEKIEVLEVKENYKTPITLSELKGHYEFNRMKSSQFIDLIKEWFKSETLKNTKK